MNKFLKIALFGAGGYLLYQAFRNQSASAAPVSAGATANVPVVPVPAIPVTPSAPVVPLTQAQTDCYGRYGAIPIIGPALLQNCLMGSTANTAAQVLAAAGGPGTMLTADQWNAYWSQVSGVHQTADLFPAGNRQALISFDTYLANRAAQGLSGLPRLVRRRA